MQRRRNNLSNFCDSRAFCVLISMAVGFLVIMGCLFVFSILVSKIDVPEGALKVMSMIALCAGAFAGGLACAKKRRKNGLFMGIVTGISMFVAVFVISLIFARTAVNFSAFSKFFWTVVCASVGGVVGVNSRRNKY
ncbi:MAG: TIGR04086 family membrane protein [Oscillospiraceae bacterium]|nr:TIGR04086 family membrane protein [Oscillospiraceae bacterium]MBQ8883470.1 TIGR04086 family membrane protein [Oscillospiraceae bacterium]